MSLASRLEYLKKIKSKYLKAEKREKSQILDEYCGNTGHNRKYITRRLSPKVDLTKNEWKKRKKKKWIYSADDICELSKVWEILDYPCGQRLKPVMGEIIDKLVEFGELDITNDAISKLKRISSATVDLRLRPYRKKLLRKITSTTKPGSLIKKQIPIRTSSWNEKRIGYSELDTVAHCGDNNSGEFINSLNLTDILTGWTDGIAVMGKAQKRIQDGLDNIKKRLPFKLRAIDPDNGSEFINWQLFGYCLARKIEFTRGRPYQKNDNAHIEQKNWTHVRKIFGYRRLDKNEQLEIMNDLYENELHFYKNFFLPNIKLIDKKRIGKHQEKIKRIYDEAKTPYQRVLLSSETDKKTKKELKEQYAKLNPAELRRKILAKLEKLAKL